MMCDSDIGNVESVVTYLHIVFVRLAPEYLVLF